MPPTRYMVGLLCLLSCVAVGADLPITKQPFTDQPASRPARPPAGKPAPVAPLSSQANKATPKPKSTTVNRPVTGGNGNVAPNHWCEAMIADDSLNRDLLLVDQDHNMIPDVREISVHFRIGVARPVATLIRWRDMYRPTNPDLIQSEDWPLRRIRQISRQDFQKIVDERQLPGDLVID